MELLIYLALAAVFIGGILTLTGKAGEDSEVRQAVQDLSDIDNAVRSYYGAQRLATAPTAPQMEGVARAVLDHMAGGTAGEIITQFSTDITIGPVTGTVYTWPNYMISYTGMRTETCAALLGVLTGPIVVQVTDGVTAAAAWTLNLDHRANILTATDPDLWCDTETVPASNETYTVHAVYRI